MGVSFTGWYSSLPVREFWGMVRNVHVVEGALGRSLLFSQELGLFLSSLWDAQEVAVA